MMYLVSPTALQWTNINHISPVKIIEMGGSLEGITDWEPSERPLAPVDVEVALRYGIPVSRGIVVSAIYILDQHRADELRRLHANAAQWRTHPTIQATDDFIDKYMAPGWKKDGEDLDRRVDESSARSVREAEADARKQLDEAPIKEELLQHWRSLGGSF